MQTNSEISTEARFEAEKTELAENLAKFLVSRTDDLSKVIDHLSTTSRPNSGLRKTLYLANSLRKVYLSDFNYKQFESVKEMLRQMIIFSEKPELLTVIGADTPHGLEKSLSNSAREIYKPNPLFKQDVPRCRMYFDALSTINHESWPKSFVKPIKEEPLTNNPEESLPPQHLNSTDKV